MMCILARFTQGLRRGFNEINYERKVYYLGHSLSSDLVKLQNNAGKIVDYRSCQKNGLVFTSNLADSTVESLINKRCKGQQHMRWSREGLDLLL